METNLIGDHQVLNAKTAIKTVELIHDNLDGNILKSCLKKVKWRGRLEIWDKYPDFILDVSHNPAGVEKTVL